MAISAQRRQAIRGAVQEQSSQPRGIDRSLTLEEVPPIPDGAEREVEPNSIRYDHERCRWRTSHDGTKIHTFIRYREQVAIDAGAFPWAELYTDGRF